MEFRKFPDLNISWLIQHIRIVTLYHMTLLKYVLQIEII